MQVELGPEYEAALAKWAESNNIPLQDAIKVIVRTEVAPYLPPFEPTTDFDRRLMAMRTSTTAALTDEQLGREFLYED